MDASQNPKNTGLGLGLGLGRGFTTENNGDAADKKTVPELVQGRGAAYDNRGADGPAPVAVSVSTGERSPSVSSRSNVDSFFDVLPRSFITRRRYSAFRPVPFPGQAVATVDEESITLISASRILGSDDIQDKMDFAFRGSRRGSSDLEVFLQGQFNKKRLNASVKDGHADKTTKEYSHELCVFVIILCLFTLLQIITISCLFGVGEFVTPEGQLSSHNGSTSTMKSALMTATEPVL